MFLFGKGFRLNYHQISRRKGISIFIIGEIVIQIVGNITSKCILNSSLLLLSIFNS